MPIIDGMNDDYIEYFPLEEYINKIKLLPKVLEHLEETNKEFDSYMNKLSKYDEEYIINYWIYLLYIELMSNQKIESLIQDEKKLGDKRIFFDTLGINHKRIHNLHNFITEEKWNQLTPIEVLRQLSVEKTRMVALISSGEEHKQKM